MQRRMWLPIVLLASFVVLGPAFVSSGILHAATACEEGFTLKNGKCKPAKKAQGCPPGTVPVPETDNCVKPKTAPKAEFEKEPWKKPGCAKWQKQCNQGKATACAKFESTCQVN